MRRRGGGGSPGKILLGIGDPSAAQSEPCGERIERVIFFFSFVAKALRRTPRWLLCRPGDVFRDRVKATESLRLGESRGSAR